jgi:Protein of unknown function (DUF2948)
MSDSHQPLRLLAHDEENLHIISAMLQDALMPVTAMVYDEVAKTFSFLVNRFCWELPESIYDQDVFYHRVHSGLAFKSVEKVQKRNFHQADSKRILYFLALQIEEMHEDKKWFVTLHFADDHDIRLELSAIDCVCADIDHPWPTKTQPMHISEYLNEIAGVGQTV